MSALFIAENVQSTGMPSAISFELQTEQRVVLIGESGTGKTVLFKSLADLSDHQGQVFLNGKKQSDICPEDWRRQVMYFSAETAWWKDTAAEHFETLPSDEQLDAVGLTSEQLKQTVSALSSGEKQRLALLRGLSYNPTILLLDEITANLDSVATLKVEAVVKAYCQTQQAAMFWITHDEVQQKRLVEPENRWDIQELYRQNNHQENNRNSNQGDII